jgi:hypothetical protein
MQLQWRKEKRMRDLTKRVAFVVGCAIAGVVIPATAAFAHAETEVGPYTVAIGFGTEPAYVGFPNSVEVIIHETASDKGVLTAADTLKATVAFGSSQPMSVLLEPNFDVDSGGSPGDYRGAFVPTQPGKYTIHVQGKIGHTPIDKTFTSGPTTFDIVTDPATIEYPTKNPTVTELNAKLDREIPRVQAAVAAEVKTAHDNASTAKTLAIVGIIVGLLGLAVGTVAIVRTRG